MDLAPFGNAIGISDILQWRECPARFEFGMRRHTQGAPPESWSPANAYGSAIHDCIHALDEGATEQEAVQTAFKSYAKWLEPSDMRRLYEDMETYNEREVLGVRTVASEEDMSFPLFVHPEQGQIYFRFRLDRLYQQVDDESRFIHIDYKSSKWVKSKEEVDKDLQIWAYNVGIHELYPECDDLLQIYEQLSFGQEFTRKNADQREEMKRWLIAAVTAVIDDDELLPTFTEFCPWCPIRMDCPVVQHELTDWATARIAKLAPREPKKKKDGSDSKVLGPPKLDPDRFDEYVELLPDVRRARQVLEGFEETVKEAMREIPDTELSQLKSREAPRGYKKEQRSKRTFTPSALQRVHEGMGDEFYYVASVSGAAVERHFGKGEKEKIESVMEHAQKGGGYTVIEPVRE